MKKSRTILTATTSFLMMPLSVYATNCCVYQNNCFNTLFYLKPAVTLSDVETVPSTTSNRFPLGGRLAAGFQKPFGGCSYFSWGSELGLGYYGAYTFNNSTILNEIPNQRYTGIDLTGVFYSQLTPRTSFFAKAGVAYFDGGEGSSIARQAGFLLGAGMEYRVSCRTSLGVELMHVWIPHENNRFSGSGSDTKSSISSNNNNLVPSINSLQFFVRINL